MNLRAAPRLVRAGLVAYAAAAVWFWFFSGIHGWAGDVVTGGFIVAGWAGFRWLRGSRVAVGGCVTLMGAHLVGDAAGHALRSGGNLGKTLAWLLPVSALAAYLAGRRLAAVRAFRRDQLASARSLPAAGSSAGSPGNWPGSR